MKFPTLLLLCLFLAGCAAHRQNENTPAPDSPLSRDNAQSLQGREDIIEVVFRHMCQPEPVENDVSHRVNLVHKVYFIALGDSLDPSAEFLARLADLKTPVKPISAGQRKDAFIYDKITEQRGAAFYVRNISMLSPDKCEVEAVIDPGGGLSASGPIYTVTRKNGKWTVVSKRLKWIS